jgi:hypothetical protein
MQALLRAKQRTAMGKAPDFPSETATPPSGQKEKPGTHSQQPAAPAEPEAPQKEFAQEQQEDGQVHPSTAASLLASKREKRKRRH